MSFILDALKKSESDRQRQNGPSLFEVKVAPPRRALPIWAVAIAVLLGINAIVISWMLLRRGPTQQPAAAAPATAVRAAGPTSAGETAATPAAADGASRANAAAAAGPDAAPVSPTAGSARPPGAPASAPSARAVSAGGAAASAPLASPAGASPADQGAGAPPSSSGAPPARSADQSALPASSDGNPSDYAPAVEPSAAQGSGAAAGATGDLPLYQQIVGSAGLPALHLDLHVFAARPKDRFVMINMQRVGEGDTLPNGVQVEAIRPDGVVLSYHGTRFLLPRN